MEKIIKNKELRKALLAKKNLVKRGQKLAKEGVALNEVLHSIEMDLNKHKEKIVRAMFKYESKIELKEYEELRSVELKNGKIVATIINVEDEYINGLEKFKENYLVKREEMQTALKKQFGIEEEEKKDE